jgi:acid phosphatase type 7
MTSVMPYVTNPGNHEHAQNFTHFTARFPGNAILSKNSGSSNMMWYSFDHGLAHIATIDTELYFYCYEMNSAAYCKKMISDQLAWLQQDLSSVDRSVTPWVIVMGHKQGLWMDSIGQSNWTYIETILQNNKVDLYL